AAATCSRLKFARSIYERDFDTVKTNVRNNTKKIYDLKDALLKYHNDMCLLEDEVCARFSATNKGGIVARLKDNFSQKITEFINPLLAFGIEISAIVSAVSNISDPYVSDNYAFNSGFTFSGFIHDQNSGDASTLKMGKYTGDYNGCGWIATYNVGVIMGENFQPADIIKYYDSHGGALVDGAFGANPLAINMYLNEQGINAKLNNLPGKVDSQIKDSKTSILMYLHENGGHYITIEYVNGMYYAYNNDTSRYPASPEPIPSIDAWLKEDNLTALFLITVPYGE
ncbi:MAG: hypothetical protein FWG43_02305, partial [Clostridiales bacterium]|nr:hypothetical protein [Clostridiales bacterium]